MGWSPGQNKKEEITTKKVGWTSAFLSLSISLSLCFLNLTQCDQPPHTPIITPLLLKLIGLSPEVAFVRKSLANNKKLTHSCWKHGRLGSRVSFNSLLSSPSVSGPALSKFWTTATTDDSSVTTTASGTGRGTSGCSRGTPKLG